MAAVSIPVSPHAIGVMTSHRPPLASITNGANSPFPRHTQTPVKRNRSRSNAGENTPPCKKQLTDEKYPPKSPTIKTISAKIEKKGQGERQVIAKAHKQERVDVDTQPLETVLQWQRHFRKVFPGYVFYFENIPEDTRRRCVRSIESLGAREAKFFSKDVTHVITTRSVPSEEGLGHDRESGQDDVVSTNQDADQPRTINPSLLNKNPSQYPGLPRTKFNFDLASIRKGSVPAADLNIRRPVGSGLDILQKAKELGIKIWQLEKLGRVLKTIDSPTNEGQWSKTSVTADTKALKQVDLSQMIKNEKIHERGDREINTAAAELVKLSGPYLYVRDMNEKTKPILVREWPKVERKEEGEWPQFRSASTGKCPFVEEEAQTRKLKEREKEHREEKAKRIAHEQAKARAQDYAENRIKKPSMQPPMPQTYRRPLVESTSGANSARQACQLPPPPSKNDSTFTNGTNQRTSVLGRKFINGEPTASGVQPSNITSAIRSQMVSSTAAGPGAKAGTSKEIHDLQRKAVERSVGLQHSQRMHDIASYNRAARAGIRAATRDPATFQEAEEPESRSRPKHAAADETRTRAPPREEKPGYCENCREKFKDFDEHIRSRKHKKFAIDSENWWELDQLLSKLVRPLTSEIGQHSEGLQFGTASF